MRPRSSLRPACRPGQRRAGRNPWNRLGVHVATEQAGQFGKKLTQGVYPALALCVRDDEISVVAQNLRTSEQKPRSALVDEHLLESGCLTPVRDLLAGGRFGLWAQALEPDSEERLWRGLAQLCTNPEIKPLLEARRWCHALERKVFRRDMALVESGPRRCSRPIRFPTFSWRRPASTPGITLLANPLAGLTPPSARTSLGWATGAKVGLGWTGNP
jgi:hypothetical protein